MAIYICVKFVSGNDLLPDGTKRQTITWTGDDLSLRVFCGIHLWEILHCVHVNLNRHTDKVFKNRIDELLIRVFGRFLKHLITILALTLVHWFSLLLLFHLRNQLNQWRREQYHSKLLNRIGLTHGRMNECRLTYSWLANGQIPYSVQYYEKPKLQQRCICGVRQWTKITFTDNRELKTHRYDKLF